jgi:hypothetical protein
VNELLPVDNGLVVLRPRLARTSDGESSGLALGTGEDTERHAQTSNGAKRRKIDICIAGKPEIFR